MSRKVIHVFSSGVVDIADTTQVLASDWNATHILADEMTNRTGVTLAVGDVVALDTANTESVVLDDVQGKLRPYFVTVGKISARSLVSVNNLDLGFFTNTGTLTTQVNGAVTRGNYLRKSATSRALEDVGVSAVGNPVPSGGVAVAEESAAGPGTATIKVLWLGSLSYGGGAGIPGANFYEFDEIAAPPNPAANKARLHAVDRDGRTTLEYRDSAGTVVHVGSVLGARVNNSANISIADSVATVPTFDSERFDTGAFHSTVTNTGRLTVPIAGRYLIIGHVEYAANATGRRETSIRLNGVTHIAYDLRGASPGNTTIVSLATLYNFAASDYVEVTMFQTSGGALNVLATAQYGLEFEIYYLGS